jgi:hypothetical protein
MKGRERRFTQHRHAAGRDKVNTLAHGWSIDMSLSLNRGRTGVGGKRHV